MESKPLTKTRRRVVLSVMLVLGITAFCLVLHLLTRDGYVALRGMEFSRQAAPDSFELFLNLMYGSVVLGGVALGLRIWRS